MNRIFWGWYIVAAAVVLSAYNAGLFAYGFTAFINPISATTAWSYTQISFALSIQGLEFGTLNPLLGMVVDRYPIRRLVFIGVLLFGLGVAWVSQSTTLLSFYFGFIIMGLGSSLSTNIVPYTAIIRWFKKDVGKASGIAATGMAIGGVFVPIVVKLIDTHGWQNTMLFIGIGAWIIGLPLAMLFRSRPQDYGLAPDGHSGLDPGVPGDHFDHRAGASVGETLKMRAFWQIGFVFFIQMSAGTAVITHVMPFLVSIGMQRSDAGKIATLIPMVSIFARLPFGFLCDLFVKKYVMALALALKCCGLFICFLVGQGHVQLIYAFAVLLGLGLAGVAPLRVPILGEYFGIAHFGTILGLTSIFFTLAAITTPPIAGWVFDTLQSYQPVWLTLAVVTLMGEFFVLTIPRSKL